MIQTGELKFQTRSVVLNPLDCPKAKVSWANYGMGLRSCLDDGKEWEEGPRECLEIAQRYPRDSDHGGYTVDGDRSQALLIVKEISPVTYEREGSAEAKAAIVNSFEHTVKHITLI